MRKNKNKIPVNTMDNTFSLGISIDKNSIEKSDFKTSKQQEEANQAHRDEGYTFHILEKGEVTIEIDFQTYCISSPAVVYLHPDQVHRILDIDDIIVCTMSISSANLNEGYLKILEDLSPTAPLSLSCEDSLTISSIFLLCLTFYRQKENKMYYPLLKDSCNTLVGFLLSQFLNIKKLEDNFSRFDKVAKAFKKLLEKNYSTLKRPGQYAALLHISTSYLNECLKESTGYSVSYLIQDRIILEAKRLLYHTDKSVKEIAFELGYADYPYFTRLFSKVTGISAITFRRKNHD
ncbi:AraC family transcriptional regulator [Flavobacterium araucananum]|uniref:AraC family transcriptional regulator n=2 Tax=Flavobacterium araucananum TaxID=946678 RepID=A0A227PAZ8_9FLAO|nr:AraC family transcriptional regulator [Flavobacterium araucananum]PWJ97509.1 AraC family transcriptional regulator [Flavobacterium araucananum]